MIKRVHLVLATVAGILAAAVSLPDSAKAQAPLGNTCADINDTNPSDGLPSGIVPQIATFSDLSAVAPCLIQTVGFNGFNITFAVGPDSLRIVNNVESFTPSLRGISVVVAPGSNVTNLRRNGAPYTSGTQIPLDAPTAFNEPFQFDFNGDTFEFDLVKPAGSTVIQGFTIRAFVPATNSITINKVAVGGDGTFNFTGSLGAFGVATSNGTGQRVFTNLAAGTYTVTETQLDGWSLTGLQCTDPDNGTSVNVNTRTATIDLDAGENVVCTYTDRNVRGETLSRIRQFLHRRADLLLETGPDRSRLLRRLAGSNGGLANGASFAGGSGSTIPFSFRASGEEGPRKMTFSTSLLQLADAMAARTETKRRQALDHALALGPSTPVARPQSAIDIWVEGHYTSFDDDMAQGDRSGHLGVLHVGADLLITPSLLVGALVQYDNMDDDSVRLGSNVDGTGWMAGPYLAARLSEDLYLDMRGAWGRSDNDIELIGLTKDSFDTNRWLASARLTGNWQHGAWRVTPSAEIEYIKEAQKSFTNALGVFIPDQSVTLGRLSFGPEFGYRYYAADGTLIEPQLSITGLWDFDNAGDVTNTLAGIVVSPNDFRGKVEGGVLFLCTNGVSLRAAGSYDGIGDGDFSAYSGKLRVSVPLN